MPTVTKSTSEMGVHSMKSALLRVKPPCKYLARQRLLLVPVHCVDLLTKSLRRNDAIEYLKKQGISIQLEL